jgi:hypothetical protein
MKMIAAHGTEHTSYYWKLGDSTVVGDCPNWIARWFLYHKFRYRDGRNRNQIKEYSPNHSHHTSSHHSHHTRGESSQQYEVYQDNTYHSGSPTYGVYVP